MFDASSRDGAPVQVSVSFWQCVKAGVGFSIGVGAMTFVFGFLWAMFYARVYFPTMVGSLFR